MLAPMPQGPRYAPVPRSQRAHLDRRWHAACQTPRYADMRKRPATINSALHSSAISRHVVIMQIRSVSGLTP